MGRPLSRQQLFGANANNNIKVHFHNGTAGVKGYIVRQKGSKRFVCEDQNGVKQLCHLVDKVRADLLPGEMSIAFVFDDGTKGHAIKIARHIITIMYNGAYHNMPWTFDPSTSDGRWQVDEAGTDANMSGSTDVGSEDANTDYPLPGSGSYRTAAVALTGVTYANRGTPAPLSGQVNSIPGTPVTGGLYRSKYLGNFADDASTPQNSWNYNFFATATKLKSISDGFVSFGDQTDANGLGNRNFSIEWKGYFQAPATGNHNFFTEQDDFAAVWVGQDAIDPPSLGTASIAQLQKGLPGQANQCGSANSMTLTAGKWYPIRIWFSEFTGNCKFQLYLQNASDKYNGQDLNFGYNSATGGF